MNWRALLYTVLLFLSILLGLVGVGASIVYYPTIFLYVFTGGFSLVMFSLLFVAVYDKIKDSIEGAGEIEKK